MTDNKKKRLSMLDNLASAGAAPTPASMMASSRPLRAARNAVDGHKVWDLDPDQIIDTRVTDRLTQDDVADLRDSIEATGQTVPILVRRHPSDDDKYLLVYGRRRLEAIRTSATVHKVRALIANLDDDAATEAQITENMARRDLTYIEKSLFAYELIQSGFGRQTRVAEVLTVSKSAVSMGLAIVETLGVDLIRAIGPADGIGRPRWDMIAKGLEQGRANLDDLITVAQISRGRAEADIDTADGDPSVIAFEAVLDSIAPAAPEKPKPRKHRAVPVQIVNLGGRPSGKVRRTTTGLRIDLAEGGFADWVETQADDLIQELHQRWQHLGKKP